VGGKKVTGEDSTRADSKKNARDRKVLFLIALDPPRNSLDTVELQLSCVLTESGNKDEGTHAGHPCKAHYKMNAPDPSTCENKEK